MKILSLHCDYINFKPKKKALKSIDDLDEKEKSEKKIENALAIFLAAEKNDNEEIVNKLVKNIQEIADQVNLDNKKVVLYPYAHLSSNLASPENAVKLLDMTEKQLEDKGFEVVKAPFGYYKQFELKCKGHPLSELSREITSDEGEVEEKEMGEKERGKLLNEIRNSQLDTSKLKENDHRIIGQKMDLFSFNNMAPGMVFWHNNGLTLKKEIVNFWREEHKKAGYEEIETPQILDKKLWQVSGHWEKYKENIFLTEYEDRYFAIKPMNCPGGMLIYKTSPKSYKDLPLRVAELGVVHRQELSGTLGGLFRVIRITQDDAHIFCTEEQLEDEIGKIIELTENIYNKFNLKFDHVELSTRPEKRIGSDEIWDKAEGALENVLKKRKMKYNLNPGDGAFYGPKIDFHVIDSQGRTWQTSTLQLDMAMPERFDIEYTDKDNEKKRPVMLHRTLLGSLERFIGVLIEDTKGNFPAWLSPIQVRVVNHTDRNTDACKNFIEKAKNKIPDLRIDDDFRSSTVNSKIKEAEEIKIPYTIVIGDKEEDNNTIAVRKKGEKPNYGINPEEFLDNLKEEIDERK